MSGRRILALGGGAIPTAVQESPSPDTRAVGKHIADTDGFVPLKDLWTVPGKFGAVPTQFS